MNRCSMARLERKVCGRTEWVTTALLLFLVLTGCDFTTEEEHIERAQQFIEENELEAGIIELKNALQKNRKNATARLLLGESYIKILRFSSAEKELARALDLGAERRRTLEALGLVWLRLEKYQEILDTFGESAALAGKGWSRGLLMRAMANFGLAQYDAAALDFESTLKADPENLAALVGLGSVALIIGDLPAAEEPLARAAAIAPNEPRVLSLVGNLRFLSGENDSAVALYRAAVDENPRNFGALLALAQIYYTSDEIEKALPHVEAALALLPAHSGANYLRALIAMRAEDFESAQLHSENVLAANRDDTANLLIAGVASRELDQPQKAYEYLSRVLTNVPDHKIAREAIADIRRDLRLGEAEAVTLIRYKMHHSAAVLFWDTMQQLIDSGLVELVRVSEDHETVAWAIFEQYTDQDFSFVDCTSFAVMQDSGLSEVFTADRHFATMGFVLVP